MSTIADPIEGAVQTTVGGVTADVVTAGDARIKRLTYPPGWRWSTDMQPAIGTSLCEHAHVGFLVQGSVRRAGETLRLDIDPKTHPYISTGLRETKFGVAHADAERLYARAAGMRHVAVVGIGRTHAAIIAREGGGHHALAPAAGLCDGAASTDRALR